MGDENKELSTGKNIKMEIRWKGWKMVRKARVKQMKNTKSKEELTFS